MKLIIAGSRSIIDYEMVKDALADIIVDKQTVNEVVSGCARGADTLGERWAKENGIPIKRMPADWDQYGRKAGRCRGFVPTMRANRRSLCTSRTLQKTPIGWQAQC